MYCLWCRVNTESLAFSEHFSGVEFWNKGCPRKSGWIVAMPNPAYYSSTGQKKKYKYMYVCVWWDCENLEWCKINLSNVKFNTRVKNNPIEYLAFSI